MAEQEEISNPWESLIDKIFDKLYSGDDMPSSSSNSDSEAKKSASPYSVKARIYWLFGREKPVHKVLVEANGMLTISISISPVSYDGGGPANSSGPRCGG